LVERVSGHGGRKAKKNTAQRKGLKPFPWTRQGQEFAVESSMVVVGVGGGGVGGGCGVWGGGLCGLVGEAFPAGSRRRAGDERISYLISGEQGRHKEFP